MTDFARPFVLDRLVDHSGVSGPGVVADGVQFPDGHVALRWRGPNASTNAHDSIDTVVQVHGHDGDTRVVWADGPMLPRREPGAARAAIEAEYPDETEPAAWQGPVEGYSGGQMLGLLGSLGGGAVKRWGPGDPPNPPEGEGRQHCSPSVNAACPGHDAPPYCADTPATDGDQ